MRYIALVDGNAGAYGVVVPDLPGCTSVGPRRMKLYATRSERCDYPSDAGPPSRRQGKPASRRITRGVEKVGRT